MHEGLATVHEGFVARTWVREFRDSSGRMRSVPDYIFNQFCYPRVAQHLANSNVRIAHPVGDETTIYGFIVYTDESLHIIYTRKDWRKRGIARLLLSGIDTRSRRWTTETRDGRAWACEKWPNRGHQPFWMVEVARGSAGSSEKGIPGT